MSLCRTPSKSTSSPSVTSWYVTQLVELGPEETLFEAMLPSAPVGWPQISA